MGPQGPAQGLVQSRAGEHLVTSARKRQRRPVPSLTAPAQTAFLEMGFCPGSGQIWGEGPSMTPVPGRRDCWRERLLPGAELAPPCPAGHAFPWPSSTASALRARPSPAHSARPSGDVRVPVCKCRRKARVEGRLSKGDGSTVPCHENVGAVTA